MKKIFAAVIFVVLLGAGIFAVLAWRAQQAEAAQSSLQRATVTRGSLTATVGATGVVRSNQTALLVWKTTGTVDQVNARVGEDVEAGTLLATLLDESLPQNVLLARAELTNAQRALDDLLNSDVARTQSQQALAAAQRAVLEAEQAAVVYDEQEHRDALDDAREVVVDRRDELSDAREDFEPYESWAEDNATRRDFKDALDDAQRAYDDAVRALRLLELNADTARTNLALSQARLAEAERENERLANGPDPDDISSAEARVAASQATLNTARLESPFPGTITEANAKQGSQAASGQTAFRIDDLSRLLVDVRVTEVDINRVQVDQPVNVTFDAIQGGEYQGRVSEVARVGITVQGVVEFVVTVELENADELVKPGMTAAVNIIVNRIENVLLVPNRSVRSFEGQRVVYAIRNNTVTRIPITLGATSDTNSELIGGDLQAGEQIVLNPPSTLNGGGPPFMQR